ncbi:unnamed protein product [Peronospora belbahrii]|uniref:Uncharacterized protein n=1 Tax=Peronospora belbahrii TaxID=622444 RepID=A0ABN8D7P6_9STRA|nr:unnamed protein product [Peronospora belbahrii]
MTQLPTSLPKLSRSSHDRPSRSSLKTYDSIQSSYKYIQYKSKSKYSQETDPLNGGPPPMSTPYLVYSNSRLPMTRSNETTKTNHGRDKQDDDEKPLSSAMRSGLARPPSSRVRFQGHETLSREKSERDYQEMERTQCQEQGKEREARRHREKDLQHGKASGRPNGSEPLSSIATILRGRRSASIENPPKSAIKLSAYDKMMQTIPTSPVGRSRRSSIGNSPPKSDIKISAFDDPKDEAVEVVAPHTTDHRGKVVEQVRIEPTSDRIAAKAPLPLVVPEPEAPHSAFDVDDEDTLTNETDDSYDYEFSDFDTDSEDTPSRCLVSEANAGKVDADPGFVENNAADSSRQVGEDKGTSSCSATELPIVKEGKEGERHRVSKLTARDLALHALGRASTCSISDVGSPVSSANERDV